MGPTPHHLWDDFRDLESQRDLSLKKEPWGKDQMKQSVTAELTDEGMVLGGKLWNIVDS
jgi:hypothetical protein